MAGATARLHFVDVDAEHGLEVLRRRLEKGPLVSLEVEPGGGTDMASGSSPRAWRSSMRISVKQFVSW